MISAWKLAKYAALLVTYRAAIGLATVASRSSTNSENDWLRSKQAYRYATAPAQQVAELICAR